LTLAMADFYQATFVAPRDPYAALWLDIANARAGLPSRLAGAAARLDMTRWPAPIVKFYLGEITADALLAEGNAADAAVRANRLCEANAFMGERALGRDEKDEATRLFRRVVANCAANSRPRVDARDELIAMAR
jgi:lipoprotein NlpI